MSEQGKKKAVAPVLQNMQDYISNHYMDELLDEVCAGIELGIVENLEIDVSNGKVVVDRNDSKIVRTDLWWKDRTHLLADIRMRTKIGLSQDSGIPRYYVRYINFSAEFTLDGGITLHPGIKELSTCCLPERKFPRLSKYLVPVLTYDEMEIMVLQLLRRYIGEHAAMTYQEKGATALAEAMGLKIKRVSLYRNHHTSAILYFKEGHARVVASGAIGSATDDEGFQDMTVPEKTSHSDAMFSTLIDYKQEAYYAEHSVITLDSIYGRRSYRIFAVLNMKVSDWDPAAASFGSGRAFLQFVNRAKRKALFNTGVDVKEDDHILTLITCDRSFGGASGRLIVMAVQEPA